MSDTFFADDDREAIDTVESLIHAARGYVRPSDDLRPRTLEAAREARRQRRTNRRFGGMTLGVVLFALCGIPHWNADPGAEQLARASAVIRHYDVNEEAALRTLRAGFDPGWGFLEAFSELRRKQAELFDNAM